MLGCSAEGGAQALKRTAGDKFAGYAGRVQRYRRPLQTSLMTAVDHAADFYLQALHGGIDIAGGSAAADFLA